MAQPTLRPNAANREFQQWAGEQRVTVANVERPRLAACLNFADSSDGIALGGKSGSFKEAERENQGVCEAEVHSVWQLRFVNYQFGHFGRKSALHIGEKLAGQEEQEPVS